VAFDQFVEAIGEDNFRPVTEQAAEMVNRLGPMRAAASGGYVRHERARQSVREPQRGSRSTLHAPRRA
jgi:hypothetical protein